MILWLNSQGADVRSSVSGKTDILLVGENPGDNKLRDAHNKGVPTLWWPMALYLGIFDVRGEYQWPTIPKEIVAQVITSMATIIEELYIKGVQDDSTKHLRAFIHATNALRAILVYAHGKSRGSVGEGYDADTGGT